MYDLILPEQPATLRLERVALEPGALLYPSPGALAQFGLTLAADEPLGFETEDAIENIGDKLITVHVLTVIPVDPASEEAAALAEDGTLDTVFAATLPAEMIPAAGNLDFVVWRAAIEPGARVPYQGQMQGMQISHVLEGELTLRGDGSLQVFRGASVAANAADVPPGAEVVLHPGDTAV